jgi:hypothetical protein
MLERVADAGVDHDDCDSGRERDVAVLLAAAVEQERVAAAREQRARRVHQPAGDTHGAGFGLTHEPRELEPVELERRRTAQREGE